MFELCRNALLVVLLALTAGCPASLPTPGSTSDVCSDADDAVDTVSPASGERGADGPGACVPHQNANSDCGPACNARIQLPSGGYYCSVSCNGEGPGPCSAAGSGLTCFNDECVPACSTDAACTSAGFTRCATIFGACATP